MRSRTLCPTPLAMLGFGLTWTCRGLAHIVRTEFILTVCLAVSRRQFLCRHPWTLALLFFPPTLLKWPLSFVERECVEDVPFRGEHSVVSYSRYLGQLWVFANHCLLQIEVSLLRVERCTTFKYNKRSRRISFIFHIISFSRIIVISSPLCPMTYSYWF